MPVPSSTPRGPARCCTTGIIPGYTMVRPCIHAAPPTASTKQYRPSTPRARFAKRVLATIPACEVACDTRRRTATMRTHNDVVQRVPTAREAMPECYITGCTRSVHCTTGHSIAYGIITLAYTVPTGLTWSTLTTPTDPRPSVNNVQRRAVIDQQLSVRLVYPLLEATTSPYLTVFIIINRTVPLRTHTYSRSTVPYSVTPVRQR